jgi:imidazolonepropionase-like amidohydrolase
VGVIHGLDFGKEPEDPDGKDAGKKPGEKKAGEKPGDEAEKEQPKEGASKEDEPDADKPAGPAPFDPRPPLAARRDVHRRWLENVRGVAELRSKGVAVAFGSFGREPDKLFADLRVAREKGGLSADDALAGFTTAAAEVLGGRTPRGEVVGGAPALLTGWRGEPFAKSARPALLVVDGVLFDRRPESAEEFAKAEKEEKEKKDEEKKPPAEDGQVAKPADATVVDWPVELDSDREPSFRTGGELLITHATVLTASHGTLEDTDVLVRAGRIAEIGRGLSAPEGVRVVDAAGRFLAPGVIDCHSHTAIRGGINEWTRVVTPEVSIEDEVDPDDVNVFRALAGGVTSMRLLHGSANAIGGRHEVVKLRWGGTASEMVFEGAPRGVKFALGENPKQSNSREGTRYPKTRMGVESVIRRSLEAGRAYAAEQAAWKDDESGDPPRRDLRLEALAGMLDGSIRVHSHCYRADEMLMLIRVCEDFGIRIATLQHVLEGYKVGPEIAAHGAGGSTFVDWWGYKAEVQDATPYNSALMTQAGVNVSVNSDSDEHLRRLYLEAAKTIHYGGMAEEAALRTVTLNPAQQLGVGDRTGSIDVGKDADLALYSLHPFDVRTQVLMTFVDGELYFERREGRYDAWVGELQRRIADGKASAKAGPAAPSAVEQRARAVAPDALAALSLPRDGTRAPSNPSRPAGEPVALVGGTVHTMERRDGALVSFSPGTVLMEGGKLRGVYEGAGTPPVGYRVVDCTGLHVWPGFIDAGCTVGLQEVESVAGTMDVREIGEDQPDLRASVAWHPDSAHIPVTRVNGTTTALVVPRGGRVQGQSSAMALEGWTAGDALVKDAVALHVVAPRTPRKVEEEDQPELLGEKWEHMCEAAAFERPRTGRGRARGAAPEGELPSRVRQTWQPLREMFESAREHARVAGEARRQGRPGPEWNPRLAALAPYALGQAPVVFHADWADQIADALDFSKEQGLVPMIAGGQQAWKVADRLALADVPVLVGPILNLPSEDDEPYDAPFATPGLLQRLGVRFAFRSNESSSARDLPYHVGMAVAFGLPQDDAMHALTAGAAEILGLQDVGTLTPGKRADVIVSDGDPLQIRSAMRHVFIGGRDVGLQTHHTKLYEKYSGRLRDPASPNRP